MDTVSYLFSHILMKGIITMGKFTYYCPECGDELEISHEIGTVKEIKCHCGAKMAVKLQSTHFEIHGYCADNNYSKKGE